MPSKADETYQESIQALADWITFLEGKQRQYARQLERASAAQQGRGDEALTEVGEDAEAAIHEVPLAEEDPEMAAWDEVEKEDFSLIEEDAPAMDTWGFEEEEEEAEDSKETKSSRQRRTCGQEAEKVEEGGADGMDPWL